MKTVSRASVTDWFEEGIKVVLWVEKGGDGDGDGGGGGTGSSACVGGGGEAGVGGGGLNKFIWRS